MTLVLIAPCSTSWATGTQSRQLGLKTQLGIEMKKLFYLKGVTGWGNFGTGSNSSLQHIETSPVDRWAPSFVWLWLGAWLPSCIPGSGQGGVLCRGGTTGAPCCLAFAVPSRDFLEMQQTVHPTVCWRTQRLFDFQPATATRAVFQMPMERREGERPTAQHGKLPDQARNSCFTV